RPVLHPLALERLRDHHWPGNVRQLQKVLCRAAGCCQGLQILPEDIDFGGIDRAEKPTPRPTEAGDLAPLRALSEAAWRAGKPDLWEHLSNQLERELLAFGLAQPGQSQVQLADRLGVSRNYLRARLKKYGFTEPREG